MKPLGSKKTRTRVKGHQDCGVCHPRSKGGRATEKVRWVNQELKETTTRGEAMLTKDFELHPDLQEASLEKACEMANYLVRCNDPRSDLPADGPWPHEVTADLSYMLEYLRLNFTLVPRKYEK